MRVRAAAMIMACTAAPAVAVPANQYCDPIGFCFAAPEPFTVSRQQGPDFDILIFDFASGIPSGRLYVGQHPSFPLCEADCEVDGDVPDRRVRDSRGMIVERLWGPIDPCGRGAAYLVHLYGYAEEIDPMRFVVERRCE